jgi:hypothetical protein
LPEHNTEYDHEPDYAGDFEHVHIYGNHVRVYAINHDDKPDVEFNDDGSVRIHGHDYHVATDRDNNAYYVARLEGGNPVDHYFRAGHEPDRSAPD